MASTPIRNEALSKLDSQLTCAVCLERYTDPRTLPCAHSYCTECIGRFPVEVENGQHYVRCPLCRRLAQLGNDGPFALPIAFHINNLKEIDKLLKTTPTVRLCRIHGNEPMEFYCETCEEHICFKCCTEETHHQHRCERARDTFAKHTQQIEACLQPLKKRIDEVEQTLARFDTREREIRKNGEAVQEEIDKTYHDLVNQLQESRRKSSQVASTILEEKLQLHSLQRANVEAVLVRLKNCRDFVEEELRSRDGYQIQAAKKHLVKRIHGTFSEIKMRNMLPVQAPNSAFTADKSTPSACCRIGDFSSKQSFSFPGLLSVDVPSHVLVYRQVEVPITTPISLSASRLCCQLLSAQNKDAKHAVCPVYAVGDGQFRFTFLSSTAGLYQLRVLVDEDDVYGSPFSVHVVEWKRQNLESFARGLSCPYGIAVTADGQQVIVSEWGDHCVAVLSCTGQVVKKFGGRTSDCKYPWGVALSDDGCVFVATDKGTLRKFSLNSSYEASYNKLGVGVAVHPHSGKVFCTNHVKHKITVLNSDLTYCYCFGNEQLLTFPCDIAIDTKGMVYVADRDGGVVLKFTPKGKHLSTIGSIGEQHHHLGWPLGICIDSNDVMYVADEKKRQVIMFTVEGRFLGNVGYCGKLLLDPRKVAADKIGNVYVCDHSGEVLVSRPLY